MRLSNWFWHCIVFPRGLVMLQNEAHKVAVAYLMEWSYLNFPNAGEKDKNTKVLPYFPLSEHFVTFIFVCIACAQTLKINHCEKAQSAIITNRLAITTLEVITPGTPRGDRLGFILAAASATSKIRPMNVVAFHR